MNTLRNPALGLAALAACLAMGSAMAQSVTRVEVFANSAMHVHSPANPPYQLLVYRLDALQQVQAQINQQVPKTEAEAREYFARNQEQIKRMISPAVMHGANGINLARHYGLERIPAIVFDGQSVVYGVTDVEQALALLRKSQGR